MTKQRTIVHALRFRLEAAFVAVAALTCGSAHAGGLQPSLLCSASSELSATGRQAARVVQSPRNPEVCIREKLGMSVPTVIPDCWRAVREDGTFSCTQIEDIN